MATSTYELIETQTLSSNSASVTFTSIPQTYRDLIVVQNATAPFGTKAQLRFNGDTGFNYDFVTAEGTGSFTESLQTNGIDKIFNGGGNNTMDTNVSLTTWQIMDYSATDKHKSLLIRASSGGLIANMVAAVYKSTTAITSMEFRLQDGQNIQSGSTFSLYGIAS